MHYYQNWRNEMLDSMFEVVNNIIPKSILASIVAFISSLFIWDSYLMGIWLLICIAELLSRCGASWIFKQEDYAVSQGFWSWCIKVVTQLMMFVLASITTIIVTRTSIAEMPLQFVNILIGVTTIGNIVTIVEIMQACGMPIDLSAFKLFGNIKNNIIESASKENKKCGYCSHESGKEKKQ